MTFQGFMEGDINSHCWFYDSACKTIEYDGFGDTCGGITLLTQTAFMVEAYLNYACKTLFDWHTRAENRIDDHDDELFFKIDKFKSEKSFHKRVAIAFGYYAAFEELDALFIRKLSGRRLSTYKSLIGNSSFYDIDNAVRFSPKMKFELLSELAYTSNESRSEARACVAELFDIRNMLAHGTSEFSRETLQVKSDENDAHLPSFKDIPSARANWQERCSLKNSKLLFSKSCNIIEFISNHFFQDEKPFRHPTQVGMFVHG